MERSARRNTQGVDEINLQHNRSRLRLVTDFPPLPPPEPKVEPHDPYIARDMRLPTWHFLRYDKHGKQSQSVCGSIFRYARDSHYIVPLGTDSMPEGTKFCGACAKHPPSHEMRCAHARLLGRPEPEKPVPFPDYPRARVDFITVHEAAKQMGISCGDVSTLMKLGLIPIKRMQKKTGGWYYVTKPAHVEFAMGLLNQCSAAGADKMAEMDAEWQAAVAVYNREKAAWYGRDYLEDQTGS